MEQISVITRRMPGVQQREAPNLFCGHICEEYRREARSVQNSLLPSRNLATKVVEIAFRYGPFAEVGGDFADFFVLDDGLIGLYVGDVVGKGLPAALYAGLVMGTLRGIHKTGIDTASVLTLLNDRLLVRPVPNRFSATLYARFDPQTDQLTFSNAGLPYPILLTKHECKRLGDGGFPSGMFPKASYGLHSIQMSPGDAILIATDGLHELCNPQGIEFSTGRLIEIWSQCAGKSAEDSVKFLFDALGAYSDTGPQDDVTAIVLKVNGN